MRVLEIALNDIEGIKELQPDGWPDITPHFDFYIRSSFCRALKVVIDKRIVAIGAVVFHANSAWLGHIITHKDFRNRGCGTFVTQSLLTIINARQFPTISLIATDAGEPVYQKLGFKKTSDYHFYKREECNTLFNALPQIRDLSLDLYDDVLKLDMLSSGENRSNLLKAHLPGAKVYVDNGDVIGFYLPGLGEGLVVAKDEFAGTQLLSLSLSTRPFCALPEENVAACQFLVSHKFNYLKQAARMSLGKDLAFKPKMLYRRIGGNLG
ncbi:MAG: GNAT family N-acetyltransferase [Sphingobacteriaceae bacterium]|nr:GNAT family N-acetyltransferase [Sphingobacteriaceae bacterium]